MEKTRGPRVRRIAPLAVLWATFRFTESLPSVNIAFTSRVYSFGEAEPRGRERQDDRLPSFGDDIVNRGCLSNRGVGFG
jgi:hypothetical protein